MKIPLLNVFFAMAIGIISLAGCKNQSSKEAVNPNLVSATEKLFDLTMDAKERDSMITTLESQLGDYKKIHSQDIDNSVPPAVWFNPVPAGVVYTQTQKPIDWNLPANVAMPAEKNELAWYSVADLSVLVHTRKISSVELTRFFLDRLKKYGDTLHCVITLTEELAMKQAQKADADLARGINHGPLHGIPYGIKDLFAVEGYKTTWGAAPYKDQTRVGNATVVKKLEEAGAILLAKFSLGSLAMDDVWFGGLTRNPWDLNQGSSGSSAGSAAATAAGLVPFAIGTETWGSIVSPSTRCGVTGLRPTYGRVSRTGAMALSWSMDKVGPICRSAFDCALVFNSLLGSDGFDQSVTDYPFNYNSSIDFKKLKVGYLKSLFEKDDENRANDSISLSEIHNMGINFTAVSLPDSATIPVNSLAIILVAEAAAAFDDLTRTNKDDELNLQDKNAWPNIFRAAQFIPAVQYIQANRLRYKLIQEMYAVMKQYDVIITPSFAGNQSLLTNLTGNPCVVVPNGFDKKGHPTSISFIGNLYDEAVLLAFAKMYQDATDHDNQQPPLFK
ncbi:MAG: amidase [Lentimicrobiaceae bacterium]|jgi:Asp-tRNA(Asn)/Glu-tRNA(Gln) amidotransferase A subunit family amidase